MSKNTEPSYTFRDYILEKIAIAGITNEAFASKVGVAKGTVSTWINDGLKPKFPTMEKIADGLGVPLEEVISAVKGRYKPITKEDREALEIEKKYDPVSVSLAFQKMAEENPELLKEFLKTKMHLYEQVKQIDAEQKK